MKGIKIEKTQNKNNSLNVQPKKNHTMRLESDKTMRN